MPVMPEEFTVRLVMETRTLNIQGEIQVFSVSGKAITGKHRNSSWAKVQAELESMGFRLQFDVPKV